MIDRYTKAILTIIAFSLAAIALQNGVQMATAQVSRGCGMYGQPACQVTWSNALPVRVH